jgi:hypothetical protein
MLIVFLIAFFILLIFYQIFLAHFYFREGITNTTNDDVPNPTDDITGYVIDLSNNVAAINTKVDQVVNSQSAMATSVTQNKGPDVSPLT